MLSQWVWSFSLIPQRHKARLGKRIDWCTRHSILVLGGLPCASNATDFLESSMSPKASPYLLGVV